MPNNVIEFRCGLAGVLSKQSPDLLRDGQYRSASNMVSNQEGSISSRTGTKLIGHLTAAEPTCYQIRKLVTATGEDPQTPNTYSPVSLTPSPRYLGILTSGGARNIYRTFDYISKTLVVSAADSVAGRHWEMADYAAGESGTPWAYLGCPNTMVKDRGTAPYATLPRWGIQPATGVALAAAITSDIDITNIDLTIPTVTSVVITMAADVGLSDFDQVTISGSTGLTTATTESASRTDINDTWDIRVGIPDSGGTIINKTTMFRIYDRNGQGVTATGTPGGTPKVTGIPTFGALDGGATGSGLESQPYDWCMVYEETDTADKGNPSILMSSASACSKLDTGVTYTGVPLAIHNGTAKVIVWGTGAANVGFIRVYRRGGVLTDMIGRLVARIANPGSEAYTIITDNTADADLELIETWETDNDPPVVSTVPTPIRASSVGSIATSWQTVTLDASVFGPVRAGTLVHIIGPSDSEDVVAQDPITNNSFRAYFQFTHGAGAAIQVNAITGQPCNLVVNIGEAILVAGDTNNPHILYKSKNAFPQAFPVGTDAAGAITSIGVGTPANGIVNMTECRGQVVTLNVSAVYEVAVLSGSLTQPVRVSSKGLKAQSAWCKTATEEIWYLSDDGIYSWDGGLSRKRTEGMDNLFHGEQFNDLSPVDMKPSSLTSARMEYRRGRVHFLYINLAGETREIVCEPSYGDRWVSANQQQYQPPLSEYPTTTLYREPDTDSMITAVNNPTLGATFGVADVVVISAGTNYTSDWWGNGGGVSTSGNRIPWELRLPWFDIGNPASTKLFEEVWLDIDPQVSKGMYIWDAAITIELLLDYSDTVVDTFEITAGTGTSITGRKLISLLPNLLQGGSIYQAYGREARAISFRLSGQAYPVQVTLYRILIQCQETGLKTAGATMDWLDLGSKYDKRLYQMAVVFDTAGTDRQIVLETRGGRDGKTAGTAQVFTLSSPTDLGSGRCMKIFPLADGTIAKLMRVTPYATSSLDGSVIRASLDLFRVLDVSFPDAEQYPADIVSVTPWEDGGYEYDKYPQQIDLEVNTNGVAVTAQVQADGSNVGQPFAVTTTETDRRRNITLPTGIVGKKFRIAVDLTQAALTSGAGMWQLFSKAFKFQKADLGEVSHSGDWDDLGHKYDKRLYTVTLRWDNSGGAPVTMGLDLLTGVGGGTIIPSAATFSLGNAGRSEKTFALPDGLICKAVKLHPQGTTIPAGFKFWPYDFQKEDFPADIITVTPLEDGGYEYDKYGQQLDLEVNTNNVPVLVNIHADGVAVGSAISVQSTETDRRRNITLPFGMIGKKWRLFIDPSQAALTTLGGCFQLFSHRFVFQKADLGEVQHTGDWDDLGHPFDKYLKTITLEWDNTGGSAVTVQMDTLSGIDGNQAALAVVTFSLSGSRSQKTFAVPADTIAKKVRLHPIAGAMPASFRYWRYKFDADPYPADSIASTPWRDASSGDDKNPSWIWVDMDTNSIAALVQLVHELTISLAVNHTGSRSSRKATYAIPADQVGKMWRLLLTPGTGGKTQLFDWGFQKWAPFSQAGGEDPPDIVLWTPWNDWGWPYEKLGRALIMTIDTGGIACTIALQNQEHGTVQTFSVNTTYTTRRVVLTVNANLEGTQWRILLTPGTGGKAKLWDWNMTVDKEPPAVTGWDSYQQSFGYIGYKFLKEVWVEYKSSRPVTFTIQSDNGTFTKTLPAHPTRAAERFYVDTAWNSGLNKSMLYDFSFSSPGTVKIYPESSGVRWLATDVARAGNYQTTNLSQIMQLG